MRFIIWLCHWLRWRWTKSCDLAMLSPADITEIAMNGHDSWKKNRAAWWDALEPKLGRIK